MNSARVHLPPIQDMLHGPLSLMKTGIKESQEIISKYTLTCLQNLDKNSATEAFQPPISPVSPTASHRDHLNLLIRHESHRLNEPYQYGNNSPKAKLSNRGQLSVDKGTNGYTNHTEMDSRYSQKYDHSSDEPLHHQHKQIHQHRPPHNQSYSDHFLQGNSRRSSASSEDNTGRYSVDPPRASHRRTTSDIPLNRYRCGQCRKTFSRPSSLRIHILSHTGEKPHVCPQPGCERRFSVQSNMRRHLKVHYCNPRQQQEQQQEQQQFRHQTFARDLE